MNRAQRRQTSGTAKQARKKGIAPPVAANLTSDVIRDMEIAVGFHQTGELMRAGGGLCQSVLDRCPDLVELVCACHVLEHFGRFKIVDVLQEWCWVLQTGGVLRLSVPDLAACAATHC
jgi:hypothetical protein